MNFHPPLHGEVLGRSPSLEPRAPKWTATLALALVLVTTPASAAEKLTVLLDWFVNPDHAPLVIAKEGGFFERAGLDVDLIAPADPSAPPRLVAAGQADVAVTYQPDLMLQVKEGLPLQPWAVDLVKARRAENQKDNPDAHCLPMGLMQFHNHGQPRKIVQTPDEVVVLYENFTQYRQIFTDGRTLPAQMDPTWFGYSLGRWDGDVLVVDTAGLNDKAWLDDGGHPRSDQMRTTEKFVSGVVTVFPARTSMSPIV